MKMKCTQCGAFIAVTSPDAFAHCSYCGARAVITGFSGESFLHRPVLTEEDARRLFKAGEALSATIYWFPYAPSSLAPAFTQAFPEMDEYSPPAGDRRIWEESSASGTVIPADPDLVGDGGVVYHPFWVVQTASGRGYIIDGVSGGMVSDPPVSAGSVPFDPYREAIKAFAISVLPACGVFFLLRNLSIFWAAVLGMAAAVFSPGLLARLRGGGE